MTPYIVEVRVKESGPAYYVAKNWHEAVMITNSFWVAQGVKGELPKFGDDIYYLIGGEGIVLHDRDPPGLPCTRIFKAHDILASRRSREELVLDLDVEVRHAREMFANTKTMLFLTFWPVLTQIAILVLGMNALLPFLMVMILPITTVVSLSIPVLFVLFAYLPARQRVKSAESVREKTLAAFPETYSWGD